MTSPGKSRQTGIPCPGRSSNLPTPGRSRSLSSVNQTQLPSGPEDILRAFADAIKANDPAQHRVSQSSSVSLSPQSSSQNGRRSISGRPSSAISYPTVNVSTSRHVERVKTPISIRPASRPPSRHSDVFGRSVSRLFEVGDNVRIESLGYEGTLRYVGEIDGKLGLWAGVELSGGFTGKGKNNGSVNGKQYFTCPADCGVFVGTIKLSAPTVGHGAMPRPPSVASSRNGRTTPAFSGRTTPSSFSSSVSRPMTITGRVTPSTRGRFTPSNGRRPSANTPRARIPSAVAMPPPASPISSRTLSSDSIENDDGMASLNEIQSNAHVSHDGSVQVPGSTRSASRPSSVASFRSQLPEDKNVIEQLQSRLSALEYENERLRNDLPAGDVDLTFEIEALKSERDNARESIVLVREKLSLAEKTISTKTQSIDSLQKSYEEIRNKMMFDQRNNEQQLATLQQVIDIKSTKLDDLEGEIEDFKVHNLKNKELLQKKDADIARLRSDIEHLVVELDEEKKEMGQQIDELRVAGQETIALYEERLSASDSCRYELEARILSLEANTRRSNSAHFLTSTLRSGGASATEIDNETLRDQVLHLQTKISTLEDLIEDAHATSEKDESIFREKMVRLKEKEDGMKKELNEGRQEVERMIKSEASARSRVEEIEEALRESTLALENARAEVETLRSELANLDGLDVNEDTLSLQRILRDQKSRFQIELEQMRKQLADGDMKHTRVVHDLNKEISELEALLESKIYREYELEQEVEGLKENPASCKSASKPSPNTMDQRNRLSSNFVSSEDSDSLRRTVCEICEHPGHDIFNCNLLKDDVPNKMRLSTGSGEDVFCEDCESRGHVAADCPHSLDVF